MDPNQSGDRPNNTASVPENSGVNSPEQQPSSSNQNQSSPAAVGAAAPGASPASTVMMPSFKTLFNTAWENYKLKFKNLMILQLLILLPILALGAIIFGLVVSGIFENNQVVMIVAIALGACVVIGLIYLAIWLQAAMIHLLVSNTPLTWRESLTQVKPRLLSFFGASLLSGLIIMLGFIALVIPGLILMVLFAFSSYIAVAEGTGAVESIKKSREYARNYFWPLAGRFILFGLVYFAFFTVIGIIDGMFDSTILGNIASFFIAPFVSAYLIAVYLAIKEIKGTVTVS